MSQKLTKNEHVHLLMADAAYGTREAKDELKDKGWKLLKNYSGSETLVFLRKKVCVLAFRGTNNFTADAMTDLKAIAVSGKATPNDRRFKEALKLTNSVMHNVSADRFYVTGHSMGGTLAQYAGRYFCISGTSFNPGSTPRGTLTQEMKRASEIGAKANGTKAARCNKVKVIRIANFKKDFATDLVAHYAGKSFPGAKFKDLKHSPVKNPLKGAALSLHSTKNFYKYL